MLVRSKEPEQDGAGSDKKENKQCGDNEVKGETDEDAAAYTVCFSRAEILADKGGN